MGEISEHFEIETAVIQKDGLTSLLFNLVLEKVIQAWRNRQEDLKIAQSIKLGRTDIEIDCLISADNLAILKQDIPTAQKQIEILKEIGENVGLYILFRKTEYMTSYKPTPEFLETIYGKVRTVSEFKYLG